ncbi:MAG: methylmalonyl Co-A mutase-associated GTPase MeaB [Cyclobacteriaceae bacterium]
MKRKQLATQHFIDQIRAGNRFALSQAITLTESRLEADQRKAKEIIEALLPSTGHSIRVGITGVPGVGKSTLIDQFGVYLIRQQQRVAVLSIDPSSQKSKGSILGDKTRMSQLSALPQAYIRPTATGSHLGGVAQQTRETILLCEAAGYNIIIVETVGVGQSETMVRNMTDFFLLLMLAGAGDELQGMKRGIMEMADALAINKADGSNLTAAQQAQQDYQQALHLFPPVQNKLNPKVFTCSALENRGLEEIWVFIQQFIQQAKKTHYFSKQRQEQQLGWLHELINLQLSQNFFQHATIKHQLPSLEQAVIQGEMTAREAAERLLKAFNT